MQRYTTYWQATSEDENGEYVLFSDHEAAIAEARKQERERCIEELDEIALAWRNDGLCGKPVVAEYLNEQLSKGLK